MKKKNGLPSIYKKILFFFPFQENKKPALSCHNRRTGRRKTIHDKGTLNFLFLSLNIYIYIYINIKSGSSRREKQDCVSARKKSAHIKSGFFLIFIVLLNGTTAVWFPKRVSGIVESSNFEGLFVQFLWCGTQTRLSHIRCLCLLLFFFLFYFVELFVFLRCRGSRHHSLLH